LIRIKDRFGLRHLVGFIIMVAFTPIAFQNCADSLNISSGTQASLSNNLPFAYDTTVNTIAYMSCSNSPAGYLPRSVFTFRAGAYSTNVLNPPAGVGLTSAIWPYLQSEGSPQSVASLLQTMSQNVGTSVQLSLRSLQNLQQVLTVNPGTATPNIDYWNYLSTLDSDAIVNRMASFTSNTQRANYFYGLSGVGSALVEGSLYFNASETLAQSVRSSLSSGSVMSLTYSVGGSSDPVAAQAAVGAPLNRAYGRGFAVTFGIDSGVNSDNYSGSNPQRVLASINEVDLSTGQTAGPNVGTWSCQALDRYMIVRYDDIDFSGEDSGNAILDGQCIVDSDYDQVASANGGPAFPPNPLNALAQQYANQLSLVRNVLPETDWWIDVAHRCAIPKPTQHNGSNNDFCYGPVPPPQGGNNPIPIIYNRESVTHQVASCTEVATDMTNPNGSTYMFSNCPHFISICTGAEPQ
jgi:hypothetical protein